MNNGTETDENKKMPTFSSEEEWALAKFLSQQLSEIDESKSSNKLRAKTFQAIAKWRSSCHNLRKKREVKDAYINAVRKLHALYKTSKGAEKSTNEDIGGFLESLLGFDESDSAKGHRNVAILRRGKDDLKIRETGQTLRDSLTGALDKNIYLTCALINICDVLKKYPKNMLSEGAMMHAEYYKAKNHKWIEEYL